MSTSFGKTVAFEITETFNAREFYIEGQRCTVRYGNEDRKAREKLYVVISPFGPSAVRFFGEKSRDVMANDGGFSEPVGVFHGEWSISQGIGDGAGLSVLENLDRDSVSRACAIVYSDSVRKDGEA